MFFVLGEANVNVNGDGNNQNVIESKTDEPDEVGNQLFVETEQSDETGVEDLQNTPGIDSRMNGNNHYDFNDGFLEQDGGDSAEASIESNKPTKRGRGRPKGSKNKNKQ